MAAFTRKEFLRAVAELSHDGPTSSLEIAAQSKVDHQTVVGLMKSCLTIEELISSEECKVTKFMITGEGAGFVENGSNECRVLNLVPADGILKSAFDALEGVKALGPLAKNGFSQCMKNKWVKVVKDENKIPSITRLVEAVEDSVQAELKALQAHIDAPENATVDTPAPEKALIQRKLCKSKPLTYYKLQPGGQFTLTPAEVKSDLSKDMLESKAWKKEKFKQFNLDAEPIATAGALHPLLKVRSEYRQIFLEMGFSEMPTNNYVESSFWNFDALFQPQQHPARDAHDTFFMRAPSTSDEFPEDYLQRVKTMHEKGGSGSIGYRYDWSREEASKNILRTHTTAVSTRMLYALGNQPGGFKPVKYFSIDRVFRNEELDATHLAEFHQVEGVVADYNLTLGNLIGILNLFFTKLGMKDLKFKPAYNPYTEPSMEIFAYHPLLKKEVEIGNSGVFRPEMLRPMGLPEDVTVIAWGLSVERPTMIMNNYKDIRKLFGAGVDLDLVRDNPITRL